MILPPQKISKKEREARDPITKKNNIEETADYYIDSCNFNLYTEEILGLCDAVEGILLQDSYKRVQNPHNKQKADGTPLEFNAILENHNILKGIVNLLMGEFGKRSHEYEVCSINPSDDISYKDGLDILLYDYYAQGVANNLNALGFQLGQKVQELPPIEEYVKAYKSTFDETRLISGQEILDYISFNCKLHEKYLDLYWDWIVTGRAYTYKDVNHDDVTFEIVPSHELFIPNEKHSRYAEDMSYAVRRQIMPTYKILDKFRGRIPEELIDALEEETFSGRAMNYSSVQITGRNGGMTYAQNNASHLQHFNNNIQGDGHEIFHVVYKTYRKFGVLTYLDQLQQVAEMEVGEDYVLNKAQGDIKLVWDYEGIIYEVYKVLDFYLDGKELLENRADLNQEGLQKLPYNGIQERSKSGNIQSIIKDGLTYQRKINTVHFQVEKMINKNKDKLLILPFGLVPKKQGMGVKEQMYHADATSILWIDETAPNASLAAQMIKTVDLSLGKFIQESLNYIQSVKREYWDNIGMNEQRYADISQGAGKGVTEQAVERSALITYEIVRQFEALIASDYQGLLDLSKLAYINGKKAKYIRGDGSQAFLNMNQDGAAYHSESSYNVFVRDSVQMTEAIRAMRAQATNLIQNGGKISVLGHLFKTNNVTKLTKLLEELEDANTQKEQAMEQQKQDGNMALQEKITENDKANREVKYYEADSQLAGIKYTADSKADSHSSRDEPKPVSDLDKQLANHKIQKENRELELKREQAKAQKQKANTNK